MKDYNLNVNLGVAFKISIPKVEEGEIKKNKKLNESEQPLSYRASIRDPSSEYYSRRSLL